MLPTYVKDVIMQLETAGYETWAVGGCVRDFLCGRTPQDWDVATSAHPEQVMDVFERTEPTGLQHGTVTVWHMGKRIEVTTYRTESTYTDRRHPDQVTFVKEIVTDLARRDFTINAMAYHPVRGICDPFGGQMDLRAGKLRAVGKAQERFAEDALRILRGLRFVARFGYEIVPDTEIAMEQQLQGLDHIAPERILQEWNQLLTARYVGRVLRQYRRIVGYILPEVAPLFGFCQHNPHHRYDGWEHTVRTVEAVRNDLVLRWVMLLHDSGKPYCYTLDADGVGHFGGHPMVSGQLARQALKRLRAGSRLSEAVVDLIARHDCFLAQDKRGVRRQLAKLGEARMRQLLQIRKADCTGQETFSVHLEEVQKSESLVNQICAANACLQVKDLAVNGYDLLALGIQGKAIGETLERLLWAVVDETVVNTQENLCAMVRHWKEQQEI